MPDPRLARPENGALRLVSTADGTIEVDFVPFRPAGTPESDDIYAPALLLELLLRHNRLRIYPLRTFRGRDFMQPKYPKIRCLDVPMDMPDPVTEVDHIDDLLEYLPRGFTTDYQYGLGLGIEYKALVNAVEDYTNCTEIRIELEGKTTVEGDVFVLSAADYEACIAELSRIGNRARTAAQRVKEHHATNLIARRLGRPPRELKRGRHPVVQLVTAMAADERPLQEREQDQLLDAAVLESRRIAEQRPEVLAKLRSDIELVTLEALVERYQQDLDARLGEDHWQRFFQENPFALHFAFGYPAILVQQQASVGGRRLDGSGEKIADFLTKNPMTHNIGIFEIKKPGTELFAQYRGGVFGPSHELSGSITQVLDQKYQLERSLPVLKDNSADRDLESYAIRCCVVAGKAPIERDKLKSLELIRHDSRSVDIITYDELLLRLRQLLAFLTDEV